MNREEILKKILALLKKASIGDIRWIMEKLASSNGGSLSFKVKSVKDESLQ